MSTVCENISWANFEAGAKFLGSPKPYLKIGESLCLWGKYLVSPLALRCEAAAGFLKSLAAPLVIVETVSAGCKLRSYAIDLLDGTDRRFDEVFSKGVVNVGGFAGNACKSVSWLGKMNFLLLSEIVAFRIGVAGAVLSLAKAAMDLLLKTLDVLPLVLSGQEVEMDMGIKYVKAVLGTLLSVLALHAIYQATAAGAFLALVIGSCANLLDVLV